MNRERSQAVGKLQDFRKKKRIEDKETIRKRLRDEYLANEIKKNVTVAFNEEISNNIKSENINQLYDHLYRPKGEQIHQPLADLDDKEVINLFLFLSKNLNDMQSLLILSALISIHYKTIFLNKIMEEQCQCMVKCLYEQTNQTVKMIRAQSVLSKENRTNSLCYILIGGQLCCLKNLIYLKDEKAEYDYRFSEVQKQQYIYNYLYSWFDQLYNNSMYLCLVIIFQYDKDYSASYIFNSRIVNNFKIILKLLEQADPNMCTNRDCSLPSVTLTNLFLNNIKEVHVLQQCLKYYLRTTKIVYTISQSNLGQNRYYRIDSFINTVSGLSNLIQKICAEITQPNLGICLQQQNFFSFCMTILDAQTQHIRLYIHRILRNVINSILINKDKLENFLNQHLIRLILDDVMCNNQNVAQASLQILYLFVVYCQKGDRREMLQWIQQYQADASLEKIQYSQNNKLSHLATQIIDKKKQIQAKQNQIQLL